MPQDDLFGRHDMSAVRFELTTDPLNPSKPWIGTVSVYNRAGKLHRSASMFLPKGWEVYAFSAACKASAERFEGSTSGFVLSAFRHEIKEWCTQAEAMLPATGNGS